MNKFNFKVQWETNIRKHQVLGLFFQHIKPNIWVLRLASQISYFYVFYIIINIILIQIFNSFIYVPNRVLRYFFYYYFLFPFSHRMRTRRLYRFWPEWTRCAITKSMRKLNLTFLWLELCPRRQRFISSSRRNFGWLQKGLRFCPKKDLPT